MAHYYSKEGVLVDPWEPGAWPSPTTIMDILPKPELQAWRRVQGENLADELMKDAQERGTRVHEACEQLLLNELDDPVKSAKLPPSIITGVAEEDLPFIDGFVNWWNSNDVQILETELFLESKRYKYRGRTDLVVLLDGETWIIDIKTGIFRWTHPYQLRFYEQAYYEMTGEHCRMGVLGLTDKNKCGYRKLKETKKDPIYVIALKLLFDDYMAHNPIKQPKQEEGVTWKG